MEMKMVSVRLHGRMGRSDGWMDGWVGGAVEGH